MPQQAGSASSRDHREFAAYVIAAQRGDAAALGRILDSFRPYLLTIANHELPAMLKGKCGGSDLVQETLLDAHRGFAGFDGSRPDEMRVWLRGILHFNVTDCVRRFGSSGKRSIVRESPLHRIGPAESAARSLVDPEPTPGTCASHREERAALDRALESLTDDERTVIVLRNRDHLAWDDVGRHLGRSADAARMLWKRAILRLQRILEPA